MRVEKIAVICRNSSGSPDVFVTTVNVSQADYDEGIHYDTAQERAADENYEGPFICFDNNEREDLKFALDDDNFPKNDPDHEPSHFFFGP